MLGTTSRIATRAITPRFLQRSPTARRFISTAPPAQRPRSWKSSAARWALAAGAVWYYNTSDVFAEEPALSSLRTQPDPEVLPTLDEVAASRLQRRNALQSSSATTALAEPSSASPSGSLPDVTQTGMDVASPIAPTTDIPAASPGALEEEAESQGAFNEETGEINWDCPCLGGMAHGPCGLEFREAFSCFVYSKEEPKGVDCIERFKGMQDCFRAHPDVYGSELSDEDDEDDFETSPQPDAAVASTVTPAPYSGAETVQKQVPDHNLTANPSSSQLSLGEKVVDAKAGASKSTKEEVKGKQERAKAATEQVQEDHGVHEAARGGDKDLVPRAAHDASDASPKEGNRPT